MHCPAWDDAFVSSYVLLLKLHDTASDRLHRLANVREERLA